MFDNIPKTRDAYGPAFLANVLLFVAFLLCTPAANWMIGHVGNCSAGGPCVIPVAPNLLAPSGVLMIGLAFVLRDALQRRMGAYWAVLGIVAGCVVSLCVAPPALTIASLASYLASETTDMLIFTALIRRGVGLAVLVSGTTSAMVDSLLFVLLAFGGLNFVLAQFVGKIEAVLLALPIVVLLRAMPGRLSVVTSDA